MVKKAALIGVEADVTLTLVLRSTNGAASLDANGNFRIDDTLNPVPVECASPVLLIRTSSNGTWFAAGVPKHGDD